MKWYKKLKHMFAGGLFRQKRNKMDIQVTIKDLIPVIALSDHFKKAIRKEVRKQTSELTDVILNLGDEIMALKEQIESLKSALANQGTAVNAEFEQVKAKFEALKGEIKTLGDTVAALTERVEEFEGIDLTAEIDAVNASLERIDSISESDEPVPVPDPEPTPEV